MNLQVLGISQIPKYSGQYGLFKQDIANDSKYYLSMIDKDKIKWFCKYFILLQIENCWKSQSKKLLGVHWYIIPKENNDKLLSLPHEKRFFGIIEKEEKQNFDKTISDRKILYSYLDIYNEKIPENIKKTILNEKHELINIIVQYFSDKVNNDILVWRGFSNNKEILFDL